MVDKNIPDPSQIKNGDELRNINCYEYLSHIVKTIPPKLSSIPNSVFSQIKTLYALSDQYHSGTPYGDLYQQFLLELENNLEKISIIEPELDEMIKAIYFNPNHALERSAAMVKEVLLLAKHTSHEVETAVKRRLIGNRKNSFGKFADKLNHIFSLGNVNEITPQGAGSDFSRLTTMLGRTYKPQTTTSMVSLRKYDYQQIDAPTEYRFGTQGQYHHGKARVSPLFEKWLTVEAKDAAPDEITHVYFNNLGLDRTNYEGKREKRLTEELHELESRHSNIIVITLPADKGLMDKRLLERHQKNMKAKQAGDVMYQAASGKRKVGINDFYLSPKAKELLYGKNNINEEKILRELIDKSFATFGFHSEQLLSQAQLNAVYFHFVKYEFTDYCLRTLKPRGFNMSCKDGIDRGGVSSAYYNLVKSLEVGKPFSHDEFQRALHAAPTLVKGRGMNHHTKLIWNAVDTYIFAVDKGASAGDIPVWLRQWRDKNVLTGTRQYYALALQRYINKREKEPEQFNKADKIAAAGKLLNLLNEKNSNPFSPHEAAALGEGRLGKMYKMLEKKHLIAEPIKIEKNLEENSRCRDEAPRLDQEISRVLIPGY